MSASTSRKPNPKDQLVHFIAGGAGGAVGALVTNPLDVIRTRFQAKHKSDAVLAAQRSGRNQIINSIRFIAQNEGIPGLYRGLGPNLFAIVPARSLYFMTYSTAKQWLLHSGWREGAKTHSVAAVSAGIVTSSAINPIWVVKVRMQLQSNQNLATYYSGYGDAFRRIFVEEGPLAFYKGLGASFLGLSETVLQFIVYEKVKTYLTVRRAPGGLLATTTSSSSLSSSSSSAGASGTAARAPGTPSPLELTIVGGMAKFIAGTATYPHEVLRTRMRESRTKLTLSACIRSMIREEGPRAFYAGFWPHMCRVVPNAALIFGIYEGVVRVLS